MTGSYVIYYYDLYYLLPPKPPALSLVVESEELGKKLERVLAPIAKVYGVDLVIAVRKTIPLENEPPCPLENLPAAPVRDALLETFNWFNKGMKK